jgi:hypothetical protein
MRKSILKWVLADSVSTKHEALLEKRVSNTGQWLLTDPRFQDWVSGSTSQLLLCRGIGILLYETH